MTTRQSDYRLQIAFGGGIGGRFTIGTSTIGGTDIFATDWTQFFTGTYDDVTDDAADGVPVTWTRGLDVKLAAIESGKATFSLFNAANPSLYDPNEPTSPLNNGTVSPGWVPMRPCRLIGSNDGFATTKGLFYGFIREPAYDPETGVCAIQAEDLFYWMSRVENPVISAVSGITSSDAIGLILDSFGFTDPLFRQLSATPSVTNITFAADGTQTALDLVKGILDAEQGRCYVDGAGVFHFEDRYARDRRTTPTASFSSELVAVSSRAHADAVGNRVSVTAGTGVAQVVMDTTSEHNYGIGDIASIQTNYLSSDTAANDLAMLILQRFKDPHEPERATIDNDSSATMDAQLAVELQDLVSVSGANCYVERLEHSVVPGGVRHTTTLHVTRAPSTHPFEFGVSTIVDPAATTGDYIAA